MREKQLREQWKWRLSPDSNRASKGKGRNRTDHNWGGEDTTLRSITMITISLIKHPPLLLLLKWLGVQLTSVLGKSQASRATPKAETESDIAASPSSLPPISPITKCSHRNLISRSDDITSSSFPPSPHGGDGLWVLVLPAHLFTSKVWLGDDHGRKSFTQ